MTTHVRVKVACDWPGCMRTWCFSSAATIPSLQVLGWERRREFDFCPEHATDLPTGVSCQLPKPARKRKR